MRIYMAGGISGNLNPAWKRIAKMAEITADNVLKGLYNEGFLAGREGRHWLHDDLRLIKEKEKKEECGSFWQGSPRGVMGGARPDNTPT